MPYLKTKSYTSPSVFEGILEISRTPFPPDEISGPTTLERFYPPSISIPPGVKASAFGFDATPPGRVIDLEAELGAAELAANQQAAGALGRAYFTDNAGGQNLNLGAPTLITFGTSGGVDDSVLFPTSSTLKTVTRNGLFEIQYSVMCSRGAGGGGAPEVFIEARLNTVSIGASASAAVFSNAGDTLNLVGGCQVNALAGDVFDLVGLGLGSLTNTALTVALRSFLSFKYLGP